MNAIVNTAPGQVEWQQVAPPRPGPGQVLVRTAACGICATDLQMIAGWQRTGFPSIPGHEWSGVVEAAGEGAGSELLGRLCVAENVLRAGGEVGFEHPGGYGEFLLTEARNVYPLPKGFDPAVATLIEPLAVSVRGLRRLKTAAKGPVLVIGDGPLGLLFSMLLRQNGREVKMVGGRPERLRLARELGNSAVWNYHDTKAALAEGIKDALGGGFEDIVEASGSGASLAAALDLAAPTGSILLLGDYGSDCAAFPWNRLLHRELTLSGSNASAAAWPEAVRLAVSGQLPLARLLTARLPARQFAKGLALLRTDRTQIKIVLEWSKS